ncbi:SDR family NAD(P)-dependent oxidoreductase [Ramlibacter sp. AW1]|uniref:SDR family NAD(P)-dependent oxidoreductase n=1 Tax=Ramlibacter aurantiacus TaxID=2801330 RepID=A0A937D9J0_9BURK|nr:SDR family NAD(P)-dependent oxidoreductase [Ramlibacter aurantiacus]
MSSEALRTTLLAVVSEKTGYPTDMLDLSLELEAGLGIDSIKRVEILSAFRERMPGLPEVAPSQLAALNTLGDVLAFMQGAAPQLADSNTSVRSEVVQGAPTPSVRAELVEAFTNPSTSSGRTEGASSVRTEGAGSSEALRTTLLAVVSEKTGYPTDMLDLSLELESGLGIDSIKRVEILSAFRERMPGLPEVAPSQLAALNTLGDVLAFMQGAAPAAPAPQLAGSNTSVRSEVVQGAPTPSVRAELVEAFTNPSTSSERTEGAGSGRTEGAGSSEALRTTLLAVVSEKTGYPTDMLDLSLELESGLGIDSIKRVEILSAFRERMPGLPEVAPSQLAALNTLGDVLGFMGGSAATAAAAPQAATNPAFIAPPATQAAPVVNLLPRHAVRAVPQAAAGFTMPGLHQPGAIIGVTDDGQGVAPLVVKALQTQGITARLLTDPAASTACTGLIVLSGLQAVTSAPEALKANRRAFEFVHAMSPRLSDRDGLLVTVQDTGGDFGLTGRAGDRAYLGGIAALARTAANEWPQAAVKAIDLEVGGRAPAALAKAVVHELLQGGAEREVGLPARSDRLTLGTELCAAPAGRCVVDERSVVVATGGARGVTAICLQELARLKPRIAILGRTPLEDEPPGVKTALTDPEIKRALLANETAQGRQPTPMQLSRMAQAVQAAREVRSNLQAMQAAGAQVLYCVTDVSDAGSVQQALTQVRQQFGPVTGLVHGAGVLADKLIKDKTLAQVDSVFATKVEGLLHLLTALRDDPLQAIVLFSSVAARVGNPGQCDYAMANEVLNQVALVEAPRRPGCLVRSIGWGPWDGGMVTPALRAHFDAQRVSLIDQRSGAAAFMAELNEGGPEVQLVVGAGEPRELLARDTGHRGAITAEVVVDPQRYPFLASHCIGAEPVVPVVLVAEWFLRAAMALMPGAGVPTLRDLRVVRGVVLREWGQRDTRLRVTARFEPGAGRQLRCELHGSDGQVLHYSATADFAASPPIPEPDAAGTPLRSCDVQGHTLYGTPALFHGPELQAIRRISAMGEQGAVAELYGDWALGWDRHEALLDLAAMDGGLQLAVGCLFQASGSAMLPTHLGEVTVHRAAAPSEGIKCSFKLRSANPLQAVCDIVITGGEFTVRMAGVQLHARVSVPVQAAHN